MIQTMMQQIAPLIGWSITAAVFFVMGIPMLLGLLMAFNVIRYREWLAVVAVALSVALSAEAGGDYLYNLFNWTLSREPRALIVLCAC